MDLTSPPELGVMPEDWDVATIGEAFTLTNGRAFKPSDWQSHGLPIIRIQNLNDLDTGFNYWSGPVDPRHLIEPGTLLFAWSGTTGTSFGARVWLGPRAILNQHIFRVSANERLLRPDYALLVLQRVQADIEKKAHGFKASFVHVKKGDLQSVRLPIPPLPEQRAIAEALSDVDELITSLDRLIAKKRDVKQGAMQQLLTGKTRLPGFTGEWDTKRVDDLGTVTAGKALAVTAAGAHRPYLRTKNVLDGVIDLADVLTMPMTESEFSRFEVLPGDILLNEGQSLDLVGRASLYRGEFGGRCAMQNQLLRFRASSGTCPKFAEQVFRQCQKDGTFASIATQTTSVAHLGSSRFCALTLRWPATRAEQSAIADVLSDMDAEMSTLEARRDKTKLLKQGMMQELLTGKTRLV